MKDEEGPGAPVGSIPGRDLVWGQEDPTWLGSNEEGLGLAALRPPE